MNLIRLNFGLNFLLVKADINEASPGKNLRTRADYGGTENQNI